MDGEPCRRRRVGRSGAYCDADAIVSPRDLAPDPLADREGRAIFWSMRDGLVGDGVSESKAYETALRAARVAVLRLDDWEQRDIAQRLGKAVRTVKHDMARLREGIKSGRVRAAAEGELLLVPVAAEDRVLVSDVSPHLVGQARELGMVPWYECFEAEDLAS